LIIIQTRGFNMQAYRVVFPRPREASIEGFNIPLLNNNEVLIENEFSLISAGTDRANLMGMPNTKGRFPQYPGYSAAGHIVDKGDAVKGYDIGDRVIVYFGGHSSHSVKNVRDLVAIPGEVRSLDACFTAIAGMALQGVRKVRLELGESSMIIGQGLLGLFAVQFCKLSGGLPVAALDYDQKRLELSRALGADHAYAPDHEDLEKACRDITHGHGFHTVIEVTGSSAALVQALKLAARQGRVSLLGCTRISEDPIDFYKYVHLTGVSLIGAHTFVRPEQDSRPGFWTHTDDHRVILDLIAAGRLQVAPMISEVVSPSDAPEVYSRLADDPCAPLGIVFDWKLLK
jgi:2-desacetyl-2-hydroxyethyl bacteriochlorophyllide A dehydrogenase